MKITDTRFPKARLFQVKWTGMPSKIRGKRRWKPLYARMANASTLYFLFWNFTWRMPWLPTSAYQAGWDACWRQLQLKAQLAEREWWQEHGRTVNRMSPDRWVVTFNHPAGVQYFLRTEGRTFSEAVKNAMQGFAHSAVSQPEAKEGQ